MEKRPFLLEIGCEELPPAAQLSLSQGLVDNLRQELEQSGLSFDTIQPFATPRRIAVLVQGLAEKQLPREIERRGPSLETAYGQDGSPTLACMGFARSCGVSVDELIKKETPKGIWLCYRAEEAGASTTSLLPDIVNKAVKSLAMSKPMRWGDTNTLFTRPVHWVVMLFGKELISADILGKTTGRETLGHRFHHPKPLKINQAQDYPQLLQTNGMVMVSFEKRRTLIRKLVEQAAKDVGSAVIDKELLNEVAALVEWPVALRGEFKATFLDVPPEALITAMKTHQRCFPIVDENKVLQPYFILVSNIESKNPKMVITGNERVIHARLSDAAFFYHNDLKQPLEKRAEQLDTIVFQTKLGSLADKTNRMARLSSYLAKKIGVDVKSAESAAKLAKADLLSEMVVEFPTLQGCMGYYYAREEGQPESVALAIKEHYQPRFSGAPVPESLIGCCVALADKLDTLVGIFGINKSPSGDKDPFGLRRTAIGILRILIEKKLPLDLMDLLTEANKLYGSRLENKNTVEETFSFCNDRLRAWYLDQNISADVFSAVLANRPHAPLDFDQRLNAVQHFQTLPEASALSAAHKRVSNILKKQTEKSIPKKINPALFESDAESDLAKLIESHNKTTEALYEKGEYTKMLCELSTLKEPIDAFFDQVMIMTDDKKQRLNRLALLSSLNHLFTQVADIALLP